MHDVRDTSMGHQELIELLRGRRLSFPIATKAEFADQLAASGAQIMFRGVVYDTRASAELVPGFFSRWSRRTISSPRRSSC